MRPAHDGAVMARRRPPAAPPAPPRVNLTWHPALAAGRCIEVWVPDLADLDHDDRVVKCWTRYRNAKNVWRDITHPLWEAHPEHLPRWARGSGGAPWSYHYLAEHDPDRLASRLHDLGLSGDWRPTPAPKPLRDLQRHSGQAVIDDRVHRLLLGQ